jgi:hypothetical protein
MVLLSIEGLGPLSIEEAKQGNEENSACVKEEKKEDDNNQLVICPAANPAPAENVLTTPSAMDIRFVSHTFVALHICYHEM